MKAWIEPLKEMKACGDALEWCKGYESLDKAWAVCPRGDWMLWLLRKLSGNPESASRKKLVLVTCQCARLSLPYVKVGELRPLRAIEIAEAWARGDDGITLEDVIIASFAAHAAYAAAHASYAAADAAHAAYAAHAASYAAASASASADYAASAASAAAHAAYAADYAAYAADAAARLKTLAKCADIARQYYPVAPKLKDK